MTLLLEHGADPNHMTHWGFTALHQAIRRDNARRNIETILNHGGDATRTTRSDGRSSVALAARRGRRDLLELFEQRGIRTDLHGVEQLIAACARSDSASVHAIADAEPGLVRQLVSEGGRLIAEFAGNGNTDGVRLLLDLGVDVAARFTDGDAYRGIAQDSTALHVAAWRARHATVKLLIERAERLST
jgi:ankyrin repeat protein